MKKNVIKVTTIALAGLATFLAIRSIPGYPLLRLYAYDYLTEKLGRTIDSKEGPRIVTVGITENDIKELGWPIEEEILCKAVNNISDQGARVIGLDLYRDAAKENGCLRKLASKEESLVSIFNVAEGIGAIPGTPKRRQSYNDLVVDSDRVVRRDLVHVTGQSKEYMTFPMRLAEKWGAAKVKEKIERMEEIWLNEKETPYSAQELTGLQVMLPYGLKGEKGEVDLRTAINRRYDLDVKDGIAIIGSRARSLKDYFEVPKSKFKHGDSYYEMAGIDLHGIRVRNVLSLLRNSSPSIQPIRRETHVGLLVAIGLIAVGSTMSKKRIKQPIVIGCVTSVTIVIASIIGIGNGKWLDPVDMLALMTAITSVGILRNGIETQKEKELIKTIFGQSVSKSVAEKMWEEREMIIEEGMVPGRSEFVTVLFMDTVAFSTISEKSSAKELIAWLNRGLDVCINEIISSGGIINKFTGDGLVAIYGSPIKRTNEEEAQSAINAAKAIQQRLAMMIKEGDNEVGEMRLRIGIHSGSAMCGSVGNKERLEYTVIGDAVNCAARLESLEKERNNKVVRVLVSEQTKELIENCEMELWGDMLVKGREERIRVYEVDGPIYQGNIS